MRTSLAQLPAFVGEVSTWIAWTAVPLAVIAIAVAIVAIRAWRRERRRATELSVEERRYRNLFENARDLLFTLTPDGRIESINQAIERITGRPRSEFLGKPFADLAADDNERQLLW